jgi:hypothetical protein
VGERISVITIEHSVSLWMDASRMPQSSIKMNVAMS